MRVLIDTSFAARGPSGTATYIERVTEALRERGNVEIVEARREGRPRPGRTRRRGARLATSAANVARDLAWLHAKLPAEARRARADLVHHPLPAWSPLIRRPQVITIHDLAFERLPGGYGRVWRALARRRNRTAAARAAGIVTVSAAATADAVAILGADRERIVVAPHGPGQDLPRARTARGARHFLYVGDDEPRKRVPALLEAHRSYAAERDDALPLVLAGQAATRAKDAGDLVRGEAAPDAATLADLLAGAAALVHPSLEEGFGLTLAEAMAGGTPVLAVRNAATAELCGPAAMLVDPDGLAAAMARIHDDAALRAQLATAGRERAQTLSWHESARLHEQAYSLAAMRKAARG